MIDWEKEVKDQNKENLLECKKNLDTKEYRNKIEKWCRKYDFDFSEVFEKARDDHFFRAFFAKDAKKQNIYEKVLIRHINSLPLVYKFKKLNSGGKDALYIDRGVIRKGSEYPHNKPAKSVDFYWNIKDKKGEVIEFYVFHKYIKESGGGQGNQFKEVRHCIDVGRNGSQEVNRRIVFICDGAYFTDKKITELKNLKGSWNFVVLRSEELEKYLKSF